MTDWCPDLTSSNAPRYLAIAERIEADVKSGQLIAGDRLPAQRELAGKLGLDFTTVARGYAEARRRGVISSQVGSGTYVTHQAVDQNNYAEQTNSPRTCPPDHSMNLPPEPHDPALVSRMQRGLAELSADLVPLLRYQNLEVSETDRQAAVTWLERAKLSPDLEKILFSPGAQAALAGILATLARPGECIACEAITYPGIRSLCAQAGIELIGLKTDNEGIDPEAFQSACEAKQLRALYVNPTLNNPTTRTVPTHRRNEIVAVAQKFGVPILEDDAYGHLVPDAPLPFAAIASDITWYIGSLSKTLGSGLRLAYIHAPNKSASWTASRALRTANVMPSPLTVALATLWIEDGTADELLSFVRRDSAARQSMATEQLAGLKICTDPSAFHLWLELPAGWTRSIFVSQMRHQQIGIVESDAFTVAGTPEEAVRICLGGPAGRAQLGNSLDVIAQTLRSSPQSASAFF
jgi:DNA-binding transcriptional MocR family regulator